MISRQRPVIDFDHHSPEYARRGPAILAELRERCPVAWTENHGGFWVLTRYQDVFRAVRDPETFSSHHDMDGSQPEFLGVGIPPSPLRPLPLEADPPDYYKYRRLLNPWLAPAAIAKWEPRLQALTDEVVDSFIERGEADLVLDLGNPVPARFTFELIGLDTDNWQVFAEAIHNWVASPPDSPVRQKANEDFASLTIGIYQAISERRSAPRDDMLTHLIQGDGEGEALTDDEIALMVLLVILGGVDTTTGLFANAAFYLNEHPDLRERLRQDPSLIPMACEEFLRFITPTQALARTVARDVEVGGQQLRRGERVLVCYASANHDPEAFERADEFVVDRFPNRHAAFGLGIHRCAGSTVARREFAVMLEALLSRMSDFKIATEEATPYESYGIVRGWVKMPATFTPGPRLAGRG